MPKEYTLPLGYQLLEFAEKIANLHLGSDLPEGHNVDVESNSQALEALILEARKLTGIK